MAFQPGFLNTTQAAELNRIKRDVDLLNSMRGEAPINVNKGAGGVPVLRFTPNADIPVLISGWTCDFNNPGQFIYHFAEQYYDSSGLRSCKFPGVIGAGLAQNPLYATSGVDVTPFLQGGNSLEVWARRRGFHPIGGIAYEFDAADASTGGMDVEDQLDEEVQTYLTAPCFCDSTFIQVSDQSYLPTQQRWRAVVEDEDMILEGTSGGNQIDIVARGTEGTVIPPVHPTYSQVSYFLADVGFGVGITTFEYGQQVYPWWVTSGKQEVRIAPQTQIVQALTGAQSGWWVPAPTNSGTVYGSGGDTSTLTGGGGTSTLTNSPELQDQGDPGNQLVNDQSQDPFATAIYINGVPCFSGALYTYDGQQNPPYQFREYVWIFERNLGPITSGRYFDGQFGGYCSQPVAATYMVNDPTPGAGTSQSVPGIYGQANFAPDPPLGPETVMNMVPVPPYITGFGDAPNLTIGIEDDPENSRLNWYFENLGVYASDEGCVYVNKIYSGTSQGSITIPVQVCSDDGVVGPEPCLNFISQSGVLWEVSDDGDGSIDISACVGTLDPNFTFQKGPNYVVLGYDTVDPIRFRQDPQTITNRARQWSSVGLSGGLQGVGINGAQYFWNEAGDEFFAWVGNPNVDNLSIGDGFSQYVFLPPNFPARRQMFHAFGTEIAPPQVPTVQAAWSGLTTQLWKWSASDTNIGRVTEWMDLWFTDDLFQMWQDPTTLKPYGYEPPIVDLACGCGGCFLYSPPPGKNNKTTCRPIWVPLGPGTGGGGAGAGVYCQSICSCLLQLPVLQTVTYIVGLGTVAGSTTLTCGRVPVSPCPT